MSSMIRKAGYGVAVAAIGITAAIMWPKSPITPLARPNLIMVNHRSPQFLATRSFPGITTPTLATNYINCEMQDISGNLSCSTNTTPTTMTIVGAPSYRLHSNIPKSNGFTHRGIHFVGGDYAVAGNTSIASQTTNDFSISLVLKIIDNGGSGNGLNLLVNKGNAFAPRNYGLWTNATGSEIYAILQDDTGLVLGQINDAAFLTNQGAHCITANFNRDGNATLISDGVQNVATANLSGNQGTLENAGAGLSFISQLGGTVRYNTILYAVHVSNSLTTLAEHQSWCRFVNPPTNVSYTQTTTRKWPLGIESGFGERLGTYGPNQWPVAIQSSKVSTSNSLGTVFPFFGAVINRIGLPNEIEKWSSFSGVSLLSTTSESPDGSPIARRIQWNTNSDYIYRPIVLGGNVGSDKWIASFYMRKVSGSCTGISWYCDGFGPDGNGHATALTDNEEWNRSINWSSKPLGGKFIMLFVNSAHGNCVMDISDIQYEQNALTLPCTSCWGDGNCICNTSTYSTDWSDKSTLMPTAISRMEVIAPSVIDSFYGSTNRTLFETGDSSVGLYEGIVPSFVIRNHGGTVEATVRGKGIGPTSEVRDYVTSWDAVDGLTNTNPRKYASMSINNLYGHTILESRKSTDVSNPYVPANRSDLGNQTFYWGCDKNNTNCFNGYVEETSVWARPEQKIKTENADHVLTMDTTGPTYLQNNSWYKLQCPVGSDTSKCWIWDMEESSGNIVDRINGLASSSIDGTPYYQTESGTLIRGSDTSKIGITGVTPMLFRVSSGDLIPSNDNSYSVGAWYRWDQNGTPTDTPFLSARYQVGTGYGYYVLLSNSNGRPYFSWSTDVGTVGGYFSATNTRDGLLHFVATKATWNAGTSQWDVAGSLDGGAFVALGSIGGNIAFSAITQLNMPLQSVPVQFLGTMILKDYALSDTEVATMWNASRLSLPNLTYARSNKACYVTGDSVINGSVVTCFAPDQVPYAYNALLKTVPGNEQLGLGLPLHNAVENLLLYSEDADNVVWLPVDTTVITNTAISPNGFLNADTVTATSAGGSIQQPIVSVATTNYTYCQFVKKNGVGNVVGKVRLLDDVLAEIATTSFTATNAWQQVCVTGAATGIATSGDTQITNNGESLFVWGASLTATDHAPIPYCPTQATTYTCNAPTANYVDSSVLAGWDRVEGNISFQMLPLANGRAFVLRNPTNFNGAIRTNIATTNAFLWDSTATEQQRVSLTNAISGYPIGFSLIYDSQEAFYDTTRRVYGQTYGNAYAGPWDTYTTDLGANWTQGVDGQNLLIGYGLTSVPVLTEGYLIGMNIYSHR